MICGTKTKNLETVTTEITKFGGVSDFVTSDVSNVENCEKIVARTIKKFNKIDILINNAGMIDRSSTLDTSVEDWKKVIGVNLDGTFYLTRFVLKEMRTFGTGAIINITSTSSVAPHPNASPSYGASKAAVTYLTKHFALEFAKENIRVNAIQCGPIESEMTDQWSIEYRQSVINNIPLGRLGKPFDVAQAALYLCSEEANFITGASLNLSGGKWM